MTLIASTLHSVNTEMGDHSQVCHLGILPAAKANSASYHMCDGKRSCKEKLQCCVAGKVTVVEAACRPRLTDQSTGSVDSQSKMQLC